ncbi:MAG TPA: aldolase [Alphaproteobacteria bacterium]|jgi:hypothetical protein
MTIQPKARRRAAPPSETVHATCVAFGTAGVLLLGPSGSGKSDLALRAVMEQGAKLVADDRVRLAAVADGLTAEAPPEARAAGLVGAIEAYGLGILRLRPAQCRARIRLALAVALVPPGDVERLPIFWQESGAARGDFESLGTESLDSEGFERLGVALPLLRLAPFEVSAALKLRLAAKLNVRLAAGRRSGSIKRLA